MKVIIFLIGLISLEALAAPVSGLIEGQPWTYKKAFYNGALLWLTADSKAGCGSMPGPKSVMVALVNKELNGQYCISIFQQPNCVGATLVGEIVNNSYVINYAADQGSININSNEKYIRGNMSATYTPQSGLSVSGDFIAEICK